MKTLAKKKPLKNRLEMIIEKTKEDVTITKANTAVVIKIAPDEQNFSVIENEKGRIKVIAVIGPANLTMDEQKIHFEEALLCEIGMIRARPYRLTEGKKSERFINKTLHSRSKRFSLTENQYRFIAPTLFNLMVEKAQKKCSKWLKKGWKINSFETFWQKSKKRFVTKKKNKWWSRGARFSVSKKDILIISDIYWAELNLNSVLKRSLKGLSNFTAFIL